MAIQINENLLEPNGEPEITINFNRCYELAESAKYIKSSTAGSDKVFKLTVVDNGTITAAEVTD